MIKTEEANVIISNNIKQLKIETIGLGSSLNRILAQDIYARLNIPLFNNSAMDGYAVRYADIRNAGKKTPVRLKVSGFIAAGDAIRKKLCSNSAVRIMTGAVIPPGCDTVVREEYTQTSGETVIILRKEEKGRNIRLKGEDVKKGDLILEKGRKIGPSEITILAALNHAEIKAVKIPRIAFLITGSELIELGHKITPGKIPNSNTYTLLSLLQQYGCIPYDYGVAADNESAIKRKVKSIAGINNLKKGKKKPGNKYDMILISGGVSVGDYDLVKDVLDDLKFKRLFWRTTMKPGKPLLFGKLNGIPLFGLPGNPPALRAAFEYFIRPAILKMKGALPRKTITAVADSIIKKKSGRKKLFPGTVTLKKDGYHVSRCPSSRGGPLKQMLNANGYIIIPEITSRISKGDKVQVQLISRIKY